MNFRIQFKKIIVLQHDWYALNEETYYRKKESDLDKLEAKVQKQADNIIKALVEKDYIANEDGMTSDEHDQKYEF